MDPIPSEKAEARNSQQIYAKYYSTPPLYQYDTLWSANYQNLPRLPLPDLETTLANYLASVEPLATPQVAAKHTELAKAFLRDEGPRLQQMVESDFARINQTLGFPYSYIENTWLDVYLKLRCPSVVNINPFYKVMDDVGPNPYSQVKRAAHFAHSCLRWTRKVVAGQLDAESPKLCMSSFYRMFATARIPRPACDSVKTFPGSTNLVVLSNGHAFSIDVLDSKDGKIVSLNDLEKAFANIILQSSGKAGPSIGAFTGADRETWAAVRLALERNPKTKAALETIDRAILVVALDPIPQRPRDRQVGNIQ
jgi:carnitine O-acetyltransferase